MHGGMRLRRPYFTALPIVACQLTPSLEIAERLVAQPTPVRSLVPSEKVDRSAIQVGRAVSEQPDRADDRANEREQDQNAQALLS